MSCNGEGSTHYACDCTMRHIAKLEEEVARYKAALEHIVDGLSNYGEWSVQEIKHVAQKALKGE